jgi:competence protein ComEC
MAKLLTGVDELNTGNHDPSEPSKDSQVSPVIAALALVISVMCSVQYPWQAGLFLVLGFMGLYILQRWSCAGLALGKAIGYWLCFGFVWTRMAAPSSVIELPAQDVTVQGQVVAAAVMAAPMSTRATVHLDHEFEGIVEVDVLTASALVPGDEVTVIGQLRWPRGLLNPGAPNRRLVAAARGVQVELWAKHVQRDGWRWHWRWPFFMAAQQWTARIQQAVVNPSAQATTAGVSIGARTHIDADTATQWRDAGVYHALSVSGLHLAIVALGLFSLLRKMIAASPLGRRNDPSRCAAVPALVIGLGYTLVTGGEVATWRALLATTLYIAARCAHVSSNGQRLWGVVLIVVVIFSPLVVFDPSFQLSFAAAFVMVSAKPTQLDPAAGVLRRLRRRLWQSVTVSAWAVMVTAPITGFHFGQVAVMGIVANLVVLPLVELLVLPVTLLGLLLWYAVPTAGQWIIWTAGQFASLANQVVAAIAHIAPVLKLGLASGAVTVSLVMGLMWLVQRSRRNWLDVAVVVAISVLWRSATATQPQGQLRVTFLDVGQGDAALVEMPSGRVMLIDAGGFPNREGEQRAMTGAVIEQALRSRGQHHIDDVWISHPHPDHYLGLQYLLGRIAVRRIWVPIGFDTRSDSALLAANPVGEFSQLLVQYTAAGTAIVRPPLGLVYAEAGVRLHVLSPRYERGDLQALVAASDPVRSVNDNSLTLQLTYRDRQFVFLGDIEAEGESQLVAALGRSDVVKVAHHGSATSSSLTLVQSVAASYAVISCGVRNRFGFPKAEVVKRWSDQGTNILRTDQHGAVTFSVSNEGTLDFDLENDEVTARYHQN